MDKDDIDKDAAKNSEFGFAFIDSKNEEEVEEDDIPQPAQSDVIPQPSSSTEEKVRRQTKLRLSSTSSRYDISKLNGPI